MRKNRIIAALMLLCLAALLCGTALADVIVEPNDDFYSSHRDDCVYNGREYFSNGPTGYLDVYDRPGGTLVGRSANREGFRVQFNYLEGTTQWGVVNYEYDNGVIESSDDWDAATGWVKMSDMTIKYDSKEFQKDHAAEILTDTDTQTVDLSGLYGKEIVFWTYPHSGEDMDDDVVLSEDYGIEFDSYYVDAEGLNWGHCGYYMGLKDFWVCISDPTNENLSVSEQKVDFFTPGPGDGTTPAASTAAPAPANLTLIIIVCVAVLAVITVILIFVVRKKNKNEQGGADGK